MTSKPKIDGSELCVGCGMCCDGTLYGRARTVVDEHHRIVKAGMEIVSDGEKTYFRLPCAFESCGQCTIYETRFEVCRSFTCALLRRLEQGEISQEQAKGIVARAIDLRAAVTTADPQARVFRDRQSLRAELAEGIGTSGPEQRADKARRLLDIIALDTYLDRWFRNPKKNNGQSVDDPAAEPSNSCKKTPVSSAIGKRVR
jgi:hypothetical protein